MLHFLCFTFNEERKIKKNITSELINSFLHAQFQASQRELRRGKYIQNHRQRSTLSLILLRGVTRKRKRDQKTAILETIIK